MNWNQLKGNVTEQWIWFSGAQLDMVEGNQTHFYGSIQKSYTLTSAESNKRLSDWQNQQRKKTVMQATVAKAS